jgi:hypothetical protein
MAVDLIVSSLSKYWSGDYITPVMMHAWDIGADYKVMSPQGVKTIPKGTPYGGEGAKDEHKGLVSFVNQIMEALPFEGSSGAWNEESEHFGFYRVDSNTFGEIAKRADKQFTQKIGLIGRFKGHKGSVSHLGRSLIFIPIEFETPFDLKGKVFASLQAANRELDAGDWNGIPQEALQQILDAFGEAMSVRLPLVVDL